MHSTGFARQMRGQAWRACERQARAGCVCAPPGSPSLSPASARSDRPPRPHQPTVSPPSRPPPQCARPCPPARSGRPSSRAHARGRPSRAPRRAASSSGSPGSRLGRTTTLRLARRCVPLQTPPPAPLPPRLARHPSDLLLPWPMDGTAARRSTLTVPRSPPCLSQKFDYVVRPVLLLPPSEPGQAPWPPGRRAFDVPPARASEPEPEL